MVRKRNGRGVKQATLNATLDEGQAIRLSTTYKHEADQAMNAMVRTLEKWASYHATPAADAHVPLVRLHLRPSGHEAGHRAR